MSDYLVMYPPQTCKSSETQTHYLFGNRDVKKGYKDNDIEPNYINIFFQYKNNKCSNNSLLIHIVIPLGCVSHYHKQTYSKCGLSQFIGGVSMCVVQQSVI